MAHCCPAPKPDLHKGGGKHFPLGGVKIRKLPFAAISDIILYERCDVVSSTTNLQELYSIFIFHVLFFFSRSTSFTSVVTERHKDEK